VEVGAGEAAAVAVEELLPVMFAVMLVAVAVLKPAALAAVLAIGERLPRAAMAVVEATVLLPLLVATEEVPTEAEAEAAMADPMATHPALLAALGGKTSRLTTRPMTDILLSFEDILGSWSVGRRWRLIFSTFSTFSFTHGSLRLISRLRNDTKVWNLL
jgi:hypothetical protein